MYIENACNLYNACYNSITKIKYIYITHLQKLNRNILFYTTANELLFTLVNEFIWTYNEFIYTSGQA